MKTSNLFALFLASLAVNTQAQVAGTGAAAPALSAPTPYAVVSRDANSATWQRQSVDAGPNGTMVTNVHRYVELATGLNHLVNGQYVPSTENITISADGSTAMATNGQHQVYFPGNIYSGLIKLVTPDGKVLRSQPIGLSYSDGTNSVLLAVVTNSTGAILPSGNQVIYTNAFAGLDADLLYTYTIAGMEQDVVLRQQPPDPSALGLNSDSIRLQVLTEFISSPQPNVSTTTVPTAAGNLEDDSIGLGSMQMVRGKAFLLGTNSPSAGVEKRWLTLNGRQFLLEEVPIVSIAPAIDTLPPFTAQTGLGKPVLSKNLILPPSRLVRATPQTRFLAQATPPSQGLVLDYITFNTNGVSNYVFRGDTTYYLTNACYFFSGTFTFEGGAILKYARGAALNFIGLGRNNPQINWLGSAYRPVVFTAVDDNTVGETISGSTGNPTGYYADPALTIVAFSFSVDSVRIAYEQVGLVLGGTGSSKVADAQFVNCQQGISSQNGGPILVENALFSGVQTLFSSLTGTSLQVVNSTVANSAFLETGQTSGYNGVTLSLTNCILVNVATNFESADTFSGDHNGFYHNAEFGTNPSTNNFYPFQTVGAGYYYLTNGCIFTNQGTANIDPVLLADLQTRTVYPPAVVQTNWTTSGTWVPLVPRDTNTSPALGYHYAPIDYAVDGVTPGSTLTLSNGVAVAIFPAGYNGFNVGQSATLTSVGTAQAHNQICYYTAVQEEPVHWGSSALNSMTLVNTYGLYGYPGPSYPTYFTARFTDFNGCAGLRYLLQSYLMQFSMRDCQIGPGSFQVDLYSPINVPCVNNLFERTAIPISNDSGTAPLEFDNNLVRYGSLSFTLYSSSTWQVENNLFDTTTVSKNIYGSGFSYDHNGYLNTSQMTPTNAYDVVMTNFTYAAGPLGNYYQVSTTLVDKGSTTADQLGLFHYTTQTNQMIEGFSPVDIGLHYVAVDQYGNPLDSNSDGIPDYIEDANGDGLVDNGESPWTTDSNLDGLSSQQKSLYGDNPNVSEAFWIWLSTPIVTSGIP